LRPAAFFWAVVPPCLEDPPDPLFFPPRFDAPGELAILAARSLDMPLSLRARRAAHDLEALLATLAPGAVHEVVGDPTGALSDPDAIADRYRSLFADLQATGSAPIRRLHGPGFLVDECIYEANAVGTPFGVEGLGRPVRMRLLHVLEFSDGL